MSCIGYTKHHHKDRFDDNDPEIENLLDAKWQAHDMLLADPFSESKEAR